jgi:hypothetical protein
LQKFAVSKKLFLLPFVVMKNIPKPFFQSRSNTLRSSVVSRYSSLRSARKAVGVRGPDTLEMTDIRVNYTSALAEHNHVQKVGPDI